MKRGIVWFKNDLRLHDNETLLKALEQNNMSKDLFKKRKPNHLIIYVLYNKEESLLYKILSKLFLLLILF